MKLQTGDNTVVYSQEFPGQNYKFKFNSKMARILSDGIYGDKITALIRELSINACESHQIKGITTPIEVHIPNRMEPYFSVEDFGVGLSESDVYNVWCTYGESTKDQNNDLTGCLGLGSKTPFCYNTRTCTIQARHGGKEICFLSHLGSDGLPIIKKLSERPCNSDGVKVTIPVNVNDCEEFERKAKKVYQYFNIIPTIVGVDSTEFVKKEYSVKEDNWGISDDYPRCYNIIMGQICYPIKSDIASDNKAQTDIFVNIGDVDIEASREGLSYDNNTTKFVQNKVSEVNKAITKHFIDSIDSCKNSYEARVFLNNHKNRQFIRFPVPYKNTLIADYKIDLQKPYQYYGYSKQSSNLYKEKISVLTPNENYCFVINDVTSCHLKRIRTLAIKDKNVIVLESDDADNFKKLLDIDDSYITKLSTIDYKIIRNTSIGKIQQVNILSKYGNSITSMWENIDLKEVDFTQPGYYVVIHRYNFEANGKFHTPTILRSLTEILGIKQLYGIKKDYKDTIPANWKNLEDVLQDKIVKDNVSEILFYHDAYKYDYELNMFAKLCKLKQDIVSKKILDAITKYEKIQQSIAKYRDKLSVVRLVIPDISKKFDKLDKTELLKDFPLLKAIDFNSVLDKEVQKDLVNYINSKGN